MGGEVAGEEARPEGRVEGEAAEAARGDGEAAEVAESQRGGGGAELQDARPQLVGQIGRRHVRLDRITAGELRGGCSNRGGRAGVERQVGYAVAGAFAAVVAGFARRLGELEKSGSAPPNRSLPVGPTIERLDFGSAAPLGLEGHSYSSRSII